MPLFLGSDCFWGIVFGVTRCLDWIVFGVKFFPLTNALVFGVTRCLSFEHLDLGSLVDHAAIFFHNHNKRWIRKKVN